MEAERNRTVDLLWNITHHFNINDKPKWSESTSSEVTKYQQYIIQAIGRGYDGNDDEEDYNPWSFEEGFLYSLTVITTIGEW